MTPLRTFCVLLALAVVPALPGAAQTTTTPPASSGATTGATTGATAPGGALPLGKPVASVTGGTLPDRAHAALGQTYLANTFGDWQERCHKTAKGKDPCVIYQLLKDATGNPTAEINVFAVPKNQPVAAGATVVAPLETLLPRGVRMSVTGVPDRQYSFLFCSRVGCFARFGITKADVAAMEKGTTATLTIYPFQAANRPVEIKASLKGFTAGLNALEKLRKP